MGGPSMTRRRTTATLAATILAVSLLSGCATASDAAAPAAAKPAATAEAQRAGTFDASKDFILFATSYDGNEDTPESTVAFNYDPERNTATAIAGFPQDAAILSPDHKRVAWLNPTMTEATVWEAETGESTQIDLREVSGDFRIVSGDIFFDLADANVLVFTPSESSTDDRAWSVDLDHPEKATASPEADHSEYSQLLLGAGGRAAFLYEATNSAPPEGSPELGIGGARPGGIDSDGGYWAFTGEFKDDGQIFEVQAYVLKAGAADWAPAGDPVVVGGEFGLGNGDIGMIISPANSGEVPN